MSVTSDLDSISISFDSADFDIDVLDDIDLFGEVIGKILPLCLISSLLKL